jgi:hypothetical protein
VLEQHGLLDQRLHALRLEHRRRHPGEGGELADEPPDRVDLPDDRLDDLLEGSRSSPSWAAYLRLSRSAESRIGVSGFLTSCAIRLATSAQAACRWALMSAVMSSKVTT